MKRNMPRHWILLSAILSAWSLLSASVLAQDEDDAADEDSEQVARFEVSESTFDSWVFGWRSAHAIRSELEGDLELHIDAVDRVARLTEEQRTKLQLLGQGDIKRYFEEVEVLRTRYLSLRHDPERGPERVTEIWRAIDPLRLKIRAGLFGDGSIFRKALRNTVSPEQAARCGQEERERRAFRYRATVEWVVAILDNVMPMRDEQRQALIRLLVAETRPPRRSGEYDHYVLMLQMSRMPENRLKPLFDDGQWHVLNRQFTEIRRLREYLERNGWLSLEGDPTPEEAAGTESEVPEK